MDNRERSGYKEKMNIYARRRVEKRSNTTTLQYTYGGE